MDPFIVAAGILAAVSASLHIRSACILSRLRRDIIATEQKAANYRDLYNDALKILDERSSQLAAARALIVTPPKLAIVWPGPRGLENKIPVRAVGDKNIPSPVITNTDNAIIPTIATAALVSVLMNSEMSDTVRNVSSSASSTDSTPSFSSDTSSSTGGFSE